MPLVVFVSRPLTSSRTTHKTQTGRPDSIHLRQHVIYAFGNPQCRLLKTPIDQIR